MTGLPFPCKRPGGFAVGSDVVSRKRWRARTQSAPLRRWLLAVSRTPRKQFGVKGCATSSRTVAVSCARQQAKALLRDPTDVGVP